MSSLKPPILSKPPGTPWLILLWSLLGFLFLAAIPCAAQSLEERMVEAVVGGDVDAVRGLVQQGGGLEASPGEDEPSAYEVALRRGNVEMVRAMLQLGANPNARFGRHDRTPLILAAERGYADLTKVLLKAGADPLLQRSDRGWHALSTAAGSGKLEVIKVLLDHGIDPEAPNQDGQTALDKAVFFLNPEEIRLLYDLTGPSPRMRLLSELEEAVLTGQSARIPGLLESANIRGPRQGLLRMAAAVGNTQAVQHIYTEHIFDLVNCVDSAESTPLLLAAMGGHTDTVRLLLELEADVELANMMGFTPLMAAADLGHVEVAKALLEAGANYAVVDRRGQTALGLARRAGHEEIASLLAEAGAADEGTPPAEEHRLVEVQVEPTDPGRLAVAFTTLANLDLDARNHETVVGFSELVRDLVASEFEARWVERDLLHHAEEELLLGLQGLQGASEALAVGALVGADLLVTGQVGLDEGRGRNLTIEVLDAHTADLLAIRTLQIPANPGLPLELEYSDAEAVAELVEEALSEAASRLEAYAERVVVAPLFLQNLTPHSERMDPLESMILSAFQPRAGDDLRILRFPRAAESTLESRLAISGLVNLEAGDWSSVADVYIWGSYEETDSYEVPYEEVSVRVTLNVWGGGEEVVEVEGDVTLRELESGLDELIESALAQARTAGRESGGHDAEEARFEVARKIFESARNIEMPRISRNRFREPPSHYLRYWNARVSLLELARFLDPGNPAINREWLADRWNERVYFWRSENLWRAREFWSRWRQLNEWEEHLQHFGVDSIGKIRPSRLHGADMPSISGSLYGSYPGQDSHWVNFGVMVAFQLAHLITRENAPLFDSSPGSLHDTPFEIRAAWAQYWREEALRRFEWIYNEVPELYHIRPDSTYARWLRSYPDFEPRFDIIRMIWKWVEGRDISDQAYRFLSRDLKFFYSYWGRAGELEDFLVANPGPVAREPVESGTVPRPSLEARKEYFRSLHERTARKEDGELPARVVDFSKSDELLGDFTVVDMCLAFDKVWFIGYFGAETRHGRLLSYNPATGESHIHHLKPVDAYRRIVQHKEDLWLMTTDRGLFRFTPSTNSIQHYTSSDGLPSDRLLSLAATRGSRLYLSGEHRRGPRLGTFEAQTDEWSLNQVSPELDSVFREIACNDYHLLALGGRYGYWLWELKTDKWTDITDLFPRPRAVHYRFWHSVQDGFWINDQRRFFFVDTGDLTVETVFESPDRIMGIHHHGDFAWIATGIVEDFSDEFESPMRREATIHVVHKPSRTLVGHIRLPFYGLVKGMAGDESTLWIGLERNTIQLFEQGSVVRIDKESALEEWLANHHRSE